MIGESLRSTLERVRRRRASPRPVLPLRLRRQAKTRSVELAHAVVPAHALDRPQRSLVAVVSVAWVAADDPLPLRLRQLVLREEERRDLDFVDWPFVPDVTFVEVRPFGSLA